MPERDGERLYISAAVVGPEGLVGSRRKTCVIGPPLCSETRCFHAGDELPVFERAHRTIGVLICYEFSLAPGLSRIMYLKGARVVFNLNASPAGEVYTVTCNRVGRERTREYAQLAARTLALR